MYQFKIVKVQEGGYKFELDGIKLLVDDYSIINGKHLLKTPNKAFAFFNIGEDVYSISNEPLNFDSAEALYDIIIQHYNIVNQKNKFMVNSGQNNGNNNQLKRSA